jgi:arsenite methyltransferase
MSADAAFWNKLADKYSRQPVADPAAFERKISITVERMRPDAKVLDVGCGTGSLALRLAAHGAEIHGLDCSQEMVRIAREKAAAAQVSNVTFHQGGLDGLEAFAPASLDGICAYSLLHLLKDRPSALARFYELLAPGGFLISSTVCLRESWLMSWLPFGALLKVMAWLGKAPRTVAVISKEQVARELREAGFVEVHEPDVGAKSIVGFMVASKAAQ